MNPLRIGFLGYDEVMGLDLVGPIDAFTTAVIEDAQKPPIPCYEVVVIGLTKKPFRSESGILFQPHTTIHAAGPLDTLMIPGGRGLRNPKTSARVAAWLKEQAGHLRRIATVCTGIYGLAPTGLLEGRTVTTHWRHARDFAKAFPTLKVNPNALFLKDGPFYTTAGVTAGIDLALALIEEDFGPAVALAVARELVVYLKRPGGQEQYSEPLQFQTQATDRFADLAAWVLGHLQQDLSVEVLAERTCVCPRHFNRLFKQVFQTTPAVFVENLRLDEARRRLSTPNQTIEGVAASVGYKSADAFRRAYERRFGISPSNYRNRFHSPAEKSGRSETFSQPE